MNNKVTSSLGRTGTTTKAGVRNIFNNYRTTTKT
jgi:hypothetical protein